MKKTITFVREKENLNNKNATQNLFGCYINALLILTKKILACVFVDFC